MLHRLTIVTVLGVAAVSLSVMPARADRHCWKGRAAEFPAGTAAAGGATAGAAPYDGIDFPSGSDNCIDYNMTYFDDSGAAYSPIVKYTVPAGADGSKNFCFKVSGGVVKDAQTETSPNLTATTNTTASVPASTNAQALTIFDVVSSGGNTFIPKDTGGAACNTPSNCSRSNLRIRVCRMTTGCGGGGGEDPASARVTDICIEH